MNTNTFIFRVDASEKIGTGHLQRCLLLAKYFINKEDWDVIFLTQQTQSEIIINQAGFKCIKVSEKYSSVSDFIKTLNKPAVENGIYSFSGLEFPKVGVWNLIAKIQIGSDYRFYNIKADTRIKDAFEF